ncbi:hypothetical protein [Corynebacterium sp. 20_84]
MSFMYLQAIMIAGALGATAMLSACSSQDADPFAEVPAFDVDPGRVTLVNAGEGDKKVLAYATEGAEQTTGIETINGIYQGRVATDKVDPDAPEPAATDAQSLQLEATSTGETTDVVAEGFSMRWSADPTGLITDVKLLPEEGSSDEDRERLERGLLQLLSTMPVFPREEVGEGASWTAEARTTGQTSMNRTTTYTVTKIEGSTVTLDLDISEELSQGPSNFGPNPDGIEDDRDTVQLETESTSTTSQAEITVDLTKPIPVAGQNAATTRLVYTGQNPDFKVVQDITTATRYGK